MHQTRMGDYPDVHAIQLREALRLAHGGKDLVTPDGKLHTDDPQVHEAAVKALLKLTTPYKEGYVPPGVVNWNDADDNNAFHAKLMVMDSTGRSRPRWLFITRKKNTTTS